MLFFSFGELDSNDPGRSPLMVNCSIIYRLSALSDGPNGEIARSEMDLSKFL